MDKRGLYVAIASIFAVAIILVFVNCCSIKGQHDKTLIDLEWRAYNQSEIHAAYNHLLHRIWIDHPSYVEDVLLETPEWETLDFVLDGDFEDALVFWNAGDSIDYYWNKQLEEEAAVNIIRHRCKAKEPDTIIKQIIPDGSNNK